MATGEGSPSGRVLEWAPERFLVATEACGGGTPDLMCSSKFLGYMGIYRRKKYIGGSLGCPRGRGRAHPPGHAAHPCGPLVAPPTDFFRLYISIYPKNIEEHNRSGVPPPQASVATKNLSGAHSGTLTEGESLTGGHLHHPGALHDEEGVVHPRG